MPHFTLDLRDEFRAGVVDPFLSGYAAGETPNPCVGCNGHVRLDAMLELATRLGCADLATGHYARVTADGLLRVAADPAKDQTYMLSALSPDSVARMRFPLAELTKPEVRALAAEADLPVAAGRNRRISASWPAWARRGSSRATAGLGTPRRDRVVLRRGPSAPTRLPPLHRRPAQRPRRRRRPSRCTSCARGGVEPRGRRLPRGARRPARPVRGARLHRPGVEVDAVRLRYHSRAVPCRVAGSPDAGTHRALELELDEPFHGAAPGQSACLLRGDVIVGWATITR